MIILINLMRFSSSSSQLDRYSVQIVKGLSKIDKKNQYILLLSKDQSSLFSCLEKNFKKYILPIHSKSSFKLFFYEKYMIRSLCFSQNVDLLFCPYESFFSFLSFPRVSVLTGIEWLDISLLTSEKKERMKNLFYTNIKKFVKKSKHSFVFSEIALDLLINKMPFSRKKVSVTDFAQTNLFSFKERVSKISLHDQIREMFDISKNYFLFIGRLSYESNLFSIFSALEELIKEKKKLPFQFIIVSNGGFDTKQYKKDFNKILKKKNLNEHVRLLQNISDLFLASLLTHSSFLIDLSRYKIVSLPIVEAFFYEKPVIASDISWLREWTGSACYFIDPFFEEIAVSLWKVFHDKALQTQLIRKGNQRNNFFDWDVAVKKTYDILMFSC